MPWVPLAKTLAPDWLDQPAQQQPMVEYLLARGASPSTRLPHDRSMTVLRLARQMGSPMLPLLEQAPSRPSSRLAGRSTTPGAP